MGLRGFLLVMITSVAVQSCVADYESNGRNLSWIYDIKNSETTQNQTYKLNSETGAFRYHFDVSAVDSYKFETNSNDAVTMGCYGWKDANNKWHATNYVADSHGRRNVRNISKPVDVFPTENERASRLFIDYLPQCLAFVVDSPPVIMYVFTNHPPTKDLDHQDHVPHSSEQVHQIHRGRVPAPSGAQGPEASLPSQLQGSARRGSTSRGPTGTLGSTGDLVAAAPSPAPTRSSLRTVKGRQDLSRSSSRLSKSSGRVTPSGAEDPSTSRTRPALKTPLGIDISGLQTGSGSTVGPIYATSGGSIGSAGQPLLSTLTGGLELSKGSGKDSVDQDKISGINLDGEPLLAIPTSNGKLDLIKGGQRISVQLDKTSGASVTTAGIDLNVGKASGLNLGGKTGSLTPTAGFGLNLSKDSPLDLGKTSDQTLDGEPLPQTISTGDELDLSKGRKLVSVNLEKASGPSLIGTQFKTIPSTGISLDQAKGSQTGSFYLGKNLGQNLVGTPIGATPTTGLGLDVSKGSPGGSLEVGKNLNLVGSQVSPPTGDISVGGKGSTVGKTPLVSTSSENQGRPTSAGTITGLSSTQAPIISFSTTGLNADLSKDSASGSPGFGTTLGQNSDGSSKISTPSGGIGINLGKGSSVGPLAPGKTSEINLVGTSQISTPLGSISLDLGKGSLQGSLEVNKDSGLNLIGTSKTSTSPGGIGLGLGKGSLQGSLEVNKDSGLNLIGTSKTSTSPGGIGLGFGKGSLQGSTGGIGLDVGKGSPAAGQNLGKTSGQTSVGSSTISTSTGSNSGKGSLRLGKTSGLDSVGAPVSSIPSTSAAPGDSKESLMDIIDKSKSALKNVFKSVVDTVMSAGKKMLGIPDDDKTSTSGPLPGDSSLKGTKVYTLKPDRTTELFTFSPGSPTPTPAYQPGGGQTNVGSKLLNIPILSGTGHPSSGYKVDVPSSGSTVEGGLSTIGVTGVTPSGPSTGMSGPKITSFGEPIPAEVITSKPDDDDDEDDDDKRPNFFTNLVSLKTALAAKFGITTPAPGLSSPEPGAKTSNIGSAGTEAPSGPFSGRPYEVTTPRPVSKLHIDVTDFIPTSSRRPDISESGKEFTVRPGAPGRPTSGPQIVSGVSVSGGGITSGPASVPQIMSGVKVSGGGTSSGPALGGSQNLSGVKVSGGGTTAGPQTVSGVTGLGAGTSSGPGLSSQTVSGVKVSAGGPSSGLASGPQIVSGVWLSGGGTGSGQAGVKGSGGGTSGPQTVPGVSVSSGPYGGIIAGPTPNPEIGVTLFEPHQSIDLTELSKVVAQLGEGLTTPTLPDQGLFEGQPVSTIADTPPQPGSQFNWSVSPPLTPSSTPLAGHTYVVSQKPAEYGPTTTPDLLRTVTARYLPPPSGEGPMCSCVCPRG